MSTTAFMNLDLPTVSVTISPEWASQLNTALETVDSHDHTSTKGTQIPTAGLNINADLEFNSFKATELLSTKFESQSSTLIGSSNAASLYVVNGDLYYTNSGGTAVQVTSGSTLPAVPSAIQSYDVQSISANTTILPSDTFVYMFVDTSVSRTITLPLAVNTTAGRIYQLKDVSGNSLNAPITLATQGSDLIDGESTQELNSNYGSWQIVGDGSSNWYIS